MNILFVDQFSEPGGAQLCLKDLMPEVILRGWKPELMVPGNGELVDWARHTGITVHTLPLSSYSNGRKTVLDFLRFMVEAPRMAVALRRIVRRSRIDLVYVNGPRALPAISGLPHPVVFHAHSHVSRRLERLLIDWILRRGNPAVIAASEYVARPYRAAMHPQRVQVIYNGVADLQSEQRSFKRRPVRIGILGRIAPEKGHADFIAAAKQLARDGVAAEFLVYGETLFGSAAFESGIRAMAQGLPVTFCGWTGDLAAALRDMEILAVPSGPHEAATRVILEAFSAGTPVVAYRSGGIPEIVENKRTGILTQSSNPASLAASLQTLMDDAALLEQLSATGRREWQRRFKVDRFRTSVCDLLESHVRSFQRFRRRF